MSMWVVLENNGVFGFLPRFFPNWSHCFRKWSPKKHTFILSNAYLIDSSWISSRTPYLHQLCSDNSNFECSPSNKSSNKNTKVNSPITPIRHIQSELDVSNPFIKTFSLWKCNYLKSFDSFHSDSSHVMLVRLVWAHTAWPLLGDICCGEWEWWCEFHHGFERFSKQILCWSAPWF